MKMWNAQELFKTPEMHEAPMYKYPGMKPVFYDALPYKGKPTRVFAWYGIPENATKKKKVPGIVLVHGGGGTAFGDWIRLWNSRGYAAIAMDTCGGVPAWSERPHSQKIWPRHEYSGPAGWGNYADSELPANEQWMYHATAAVVLGHSLLRSFPEVNADKIGLTGISWGGVLTCVAAGIDKRFAFAVPVYGCGFLGDRSCGLCNRLSDDGKFLAKWLRLWDPSNYLKDASMPYLWVTGTNDTFPLPSLKKSYLLTKGEKRLSVKVRMPHGHGGLGENPSEIHDFANAVTAGKELPPFIDDIKIKNNAASASFKSSRRIVKAEFNFTRATGFWRDRTWNTVDAELDAGKSIVSAAVPYCTTSCYFNLYDADGRVYSSPNT
ncbi:MAG: acetylxylan esterase [Victivallales bacterium]